MKGGVRKRGNKWYYYFDLGYIDGKRKKVERVTNAETKSEAEQILRRAISDYEFNGIFFEPSKTSLVDYLDYWVKEYVELNLKYNTVENYKRVIKLHIKPELGMIKLRNLTPELCQKLINKKFKQNYAKKTLTIIYSVLKSALDYAVYPYKLIRENPMVYVKMPRYEAKKTTKADLKILDLDSIRKINDFLDESNSFYIPYHIGLNTGMRVSEVCGLTWDYVDLKEGTITVERILINKNKEWVFGTPKTSSSYRTIDIGETLIKILKKHKTRQKQNKLYYGEFYHQSNFVCTKENGQPVTPSSCKWSGKNLRNKLGIDFNFHSLRHTHATLLMEQGAKPKAVQERLGHARSAITIDTYSHLTTKVKKNTVDLFEQMLHGE